MFFVNHVSRLVENFNIGIYSDTMNVINVELFMMVLLVYLFIPLSVALTIFQGHSTVKQF